MKKKIKTKVKLVVPAASATPSPPIGPALGSAGASSVEFCKAFNAYTKDMTPGVPIPVEITVYDDRSFTFITKSPTASYYLKQAAGALAKGSAAAGKSAPVATITKNDLLTIAKAKMQDLSANDLESAARIIAGSARSMGIKVQED